jgi:hypothetical protein
MVSSCSVNQCKDPAFQDAKRDEALLTVVKTIVFRVAV